MNKLKKYEKCKNMFGELPIEIIERLEKFFNQPSKETWDDVHCIILESNGWMTFWQAVIAIDNTFPKSAKMTDDYKFKWDKIPDELTARRALKHAQSI